LVVKTESCRFWALRRINSRGEKPACLSGVHQRPMPFRARDEKLLSRFSQDGAPDAIDRGFGRDGAAIRSGIQRPQLGVRTEDELLHGLPCSLAHSPLRVVFSDSNFFSFSETFGCKDHWTIAPPASRQAWPPTGMTGRQRPSSQGAHCSQRRPTFFHKKGNMGHPCGPSR